MAIPNNLLPINNPFRTEVGEQTSTVPTTVGATLGVPSNLLRVNTSDISGSYQSLTGNIPSIGAVEIPQFSALNTLIPDRLFTTGSLDQIKARTLGVADRYLNSLPQLPEIPTVDGLIPQKPRIPSYGQIKNYIKVKIDRIKRQRQQASVKSVNEKLKRKENPFTYRQSLIQTKQNITNVTGRYN